MGDHPLGKEKFPGPTDLDHTDQGELAHCGSPKIKFYETYQTTAARIKTIVRFGNFELLLVGF
jgi:hypothetical protein